ncbi:penicillin acylase family protein [Musicola paradisiaca]|uniref:Peptidase S45 penicillin amidase n=1 Tax=Musicola paradisiaca (strain Ech703) TaxID=579405 RepID=C6C497_MUSP7|nr:penicillin acylase family protein [Musicola paradisiaca]ACS85471.1 peptidase S45 penicillin amidase [Musicola paradisiaca Ech703]
MKRCPVLLRVVVFILLPAIAICFLSYLYFLRSLPAVENFTLAGQGYHDVAVKRDRNGVVYLSSDDDNSIYFAMGYVQAQDRLWQLTLQQRIVQGRLSEMLGEKGMKSDIFIRTLGIYRAAQQAWTRLDRPAQDSLVAYAAGVNQAMKQQRTLPPEFILLGMKPEAWTPIDSLAWVKMFALDLGGNMFKEIQYEMAAESLSHEQLRLLFPAYVSAPPDRVANLDPTRNTALLGVNGIKPLLPYFGTGGTGVGSNAWVVSGAHTQTGYPLMANDPHLGLQQPSPWYVVSQNGAKLHTQGMSLIGIPLVIFGSNQHIAWGGTALTADVEDLYAETVKPGEPSRYKADNQWLPFSQRVESIRVRSGIPDRLYPPLKDVTLTVQETRHGPVVSALFPNVRQTLSLRWTALDPDDTSYMAFMGINYAHDWPSFQSAVRLLVAPALNLLYADTQNNIGMVSAGAIPMRGAGYGELPLPGENSGNDWKGYIPFNELPVSWNPDSGFIVSANNEVTHPAYPHFISHDWAPPTRKDRIVELLGDRIVKSGNRITSEDMIAIQRDTLDRNIAAFRHAVVKKTHPASERQRMAIETLAAWDGDMNRESVAATLIVSWARHLRMNMVVDAWPKSWGDDEKNALMSELGTYIPLSSLVKMLERDNDACQEFGRQASWHHCQDVLVKSLDQALDELGRMRGDNMDRWQWGHLHSSYYEHSLFSTVRFLDNIFSTRIDNGGSPDAINVADMNFDLSKGYDQKLGASFRMIIDVKPEKISTQYINSTGQSGNIMSEHYRDMVKPFNTFTFFEIRDNFTSGVNQ